MSPLTAAKATFALNAGECIRRLFFVIFAPDSRQESSPLSGRKSTQATVRICGASSASRVTFELERQRDQVRLTVIHDRFEPGSVALEKISLGWPLILSSLKSYVECGRVLHAPWYENEATTEQAR
ncbi:SRPBCC domain-containing protein [Bradyrhizobium septentrionale]|uniref:SRPBCC domain-containing protein n=1 Tax=Bradyrhizobium septentrionale TaxID=1404411 RepID=A0A973VVR4_9BRAD